MVPKEKLKVQKEALQESFSLYLTEHNLMVLLQHTQMLTTLCNGNLAKKLSRKQFWSQKKNFLFITTLMLSHGYSGVSSSVEKQQ